MKKILLFVSLLAFSASPADTDERLKGIACRSVHLQYPGQEGAGFYNEVTVNRSAEGTYFCVCGFAKGYYGIQEQANGKKLIIFSVWDPGRQNDPGKVKAEDRVKLLYQDKAVRVGRFGNEGTGGQSFFDYDWKIGATYRFLVRAEPDGDERTAFTAYFFHPESNDWKKLATFSTLTKNQLRGYYSFVEDFRRNKISTTKVREATFGNGWIKSPDGIWHELTQARFTADSNPVTNINAGVREGRFFLATGGTTENVDTKLGSEMKRAEGGKKPVIP